MATHRRHHMKIDSWEQLGFERILSKDDCERERCKYRCVVVAKVFKDRIKSSLYFPHYAEASKKRRGDDEPLAILCPN